MEYVGNSLGCIYLQCKQKKRQALFKSQQFIHRLKITGAELLTIIWLTNGCET
jgi:hypothetical protein